jgi:hypothetical protein
VDLSALPSRRGIEWCVWKEGEEPATVGCGAEAAYVLLDPVEPGRVARVFEGEACEARATTLRTTMQAAVASTVTHLVHDGSRALASAEGARTEDQAGPIVVVSAERYRLDARNYDGLDDLGAAVRARIDGLRAAGAEEPTPVYLLAAADVPATRVVEAALALRSDTSALRLAVARDAAPAPELPDGAPAELRAELARARDAMAPAERALWIANGLERSIGACPAILMRFASTASASASEKAQILARIDEDVRTCRCGGVDVDALELFLSMSLHRPHVFGWLPLPVVPEGTGGARAVRLSRSATVQELAAAAAANREGRPFRVVLR